MQVGSAKSLEEDPIVLDPSQPFERALIGMVITYRNKKADYAVDGDPFSNFSDTADWADFKYRWQSSLFNCVQKLSRIKALIKNGRDSATANEPVDDTLLDNAVYAVIAYAQHLFDEGRTLDQVLHPLRYINK